MTYTYIVFVIYIFFNFEFNPTHYLFKRINEKKKIDISCTIKIEFVIYFLIFEFTLIYICYMCYLYLKLMVIWKREKKT